jgi:hypothetical protein
MEVSIDIDQLRRDIKEKRDELAKLLAVEDYAVGQSAITNGKLRARKTKGKISKLSGQAEIAERMLKELGRPAKTTEMVNLGLERGLLKITSKRRNLDNGFYGAMARQKQTFYLIERGTWDLVERKK